MSTVLAPDDNFSLQLDTLSEQSALAGSAPTLNGTQRLWNTPASWAGNPLDVPDIADAFDRDGLNNAYLNAIATAANRDSQGNAVGTIADRMVTKVQADYLAAMERAFRARHGSPVRAAFHAASRRAGHGHAQGPLKNVRAHVIALISAGTVTS